jgi:hypothetical protein
LQQDAQDVGLHELGEGADVGVKHGAVIGQGDASVVEQDVDLPVSLGGLGVQIADGMLGCQVGHEEQVGVTVALDIDADDRGAALLEHAYRLAADRAGRPGDDGDLVFEAGEVRHGGLSGSW